MEYAVHHVKSKYKIDQLCKRKVPMVDVPAPDDIIQITASKQGIYEMLQCAKDNNGIVLICQNYSDRQEVYFSFIDEGDLRYYPDIQ